MDFNANSIAESCVTEPEDPSVDFAEFCGKEHRFFHGVEQRILLPPSPAGFAVFERDPKLVLSIECWCRLFRYPGPGIQNFELVASICTGDSLRFDIIRFSQPDPAKGRRAPVVFLDARSLDREQVTEWLIDLAARHFGRRDGRNMVMQRPPVVAAPLPRLAWVGEPILGGADARPLAVAIGRVFGAEIRHLYPGSFPGTMVSLQREGPFDAVYLDASVTAKFGDAVVPLGVPKTMVFCGDVPTFDAVSLDLRGASEVVAAEARSARLKGISEEDQLMCAMIRPMLVHWKIGQFSHCSRETLLTTVRARRLNVPFAEQLLDRNSEQFSDTGESDQIFLWKAHNDGDQYFLNPRRIAACRALVAKLA